MNELGPEEAEDPRRDNAGDPICDECYRGDYEFTCCWCQNLEDIDQQHRLLVITEPTYAMGLPDRDGQLAPGIYRITSRPYYGGPLIGDGYLFAGALSLVGPVPSDVDTNGYPCGHVCRSCREILLRRARQRRWRKKRTRPQTARRGAEDA